MFITHLLNKTKNTIVYGFLYFMYPLITLMLFNNFGVSFMGLLFSYATIFAVCLSVAIILYLGKNAYKLTKDKRFNSLDVQMAKTLNNITNASIVAVVLVVAFALLSIIVSLFKVSTSFSNLNILMMIILNAYYIAICAIFIKYERQGI